MEIVVLTSCARVESIGGLASLMPTKIDQHARWRLAILGAIHHSRA